MRLGKHVTSIGISVLVAIMLTGCGTKIRGVIPVDKSMYSDGTPVNTDPAMVPPYVVGPSDVLTINILRHPELSGNVTVGSYGEIRIPDTTDVVIAEGKTLSEIKQEVANTVSQYMKTEPQLTIDVQEFNSKCVYVLGAVKAPGKYALGDKAISIRDAVFMAGMPVDHAELKKLIVVNPDRDNPVATKINYEEIMYGGRMKYNLFLKNGDIVFVPYTTWSKTISALDMTITPISKVATGLAASLYIKDHFEKED